MCDENILTDIQAEYILEENRIAKKLKLSQNGDVNYLFITDIHYNSSDGDEVKNSLFRQINGIARMAKNASIDFVVVGGDVTTGMYASRSDALSDTNSILEPLKQCGKPVFVLMGNHDDNCYHTYWSGGTEYRPALIIGEKEWTEGVLNENCPSNIVHDSQNKYSRYYYYDLRNKKTRLICLDALNYPYIKDDAGNLTALKEKNILSVSPAGKYYSGANYWGYGARQLTWLITEALNMPNGYNCIFFSHMGIDYDTNCYGNEVKYGNRLREIISAYQNKTAFNNSEIGFADFGKTNGKILLYQFGHMHTELSLFSKDINLWQISTATPNISQYSSTLTVSVHTNNKKLPWHLYERSYGTVSEASFECVSVNGEVIKKYVFGTGEDYKLNINGQ